MGLFDKMFGRGATEAQGQPNAQQRFNELKVKYQSVLTTIEQQEVRLQNLHVQDNKLFIKGTAPSEDAKNKVWEQVKLVDSNYTNDLTCDIEADASRAVGAAAGGGQSEGGQTYTVKAGDNLSKISKQFYGDPNEYMRIFYANRDKLRDPDRIQV
jgi:nucleoid-associated protein YgaU